MLSEKRSARRLGLEIFEFRELVRSGQLIPLRVDDENSYWSTTDLDRFADENCGIVQMELSLGVRHERKN